MMSIDSLRMELVGDMCFCSLWLHTTQVTTRIPAPTYGIRMIYYRVPIKMKSDSENFLPYEATMSVLRMELQNGKGAYGVLQSVANTMSGLNENLEQLHKWRARSDFANKIRNTVISQSIAFQT